MQHRAFLYMCDERVFCKYQLKSLYIIHIFADDLYLQDGLRVRWIMNIYFQPLPISYFQGFVSLVNVKD